MFSLIMGYLERSKYDVTHSSAYFAWKYFSHTIEKPIALSYSQMEELLENILLKAMRSAENLMT